MADTTIATPGSTADSGTPAKPSASKDRACPYCHTSFTSSSLGRHLDLFIKDKNPKPPDGIHDIEQIRRSRGNITRRQARTSSSKREGSTSSSTKPTPSHDQRSPSIARHYTNGDHSDRPPITMLHRAGWEATGVINDIPPATRDGRYDLRRDQPRRLPTKTDMAQRKKALEERDRGRAAELALKEVLDSVKAANARLTQRAPFEFDFFVESFPSLCLRCLTSPTVISTSQLVPNSLSWPVDIPGSKQLERIRQRVSTRVQWWRSQRRAAAALGSSDLSVVDSKQLGTINEAEEEQRHYDYLASAYNVWNDLPDAEKREIWHLESMRAFAREQHDHGQTHIKLVRMEQEAANLRLQLERLNECQQPREFLLYPPNQLEVSREVATIVAENNADTALDFDKLVDKWKSRIQSGRSEQKPLPPPPLPAAASNQVNGMSSYNQPSSNGDPLAHQGISDDDLMDAPGDEDDDLGQTRMPTATMDRGMLDPKLRDQGADEVMQGIEGDGEGFVGGRLLAGLREYGGVNGRVL
ncbi:hypothetical protein MMC11_005761 [Xylographa trunciseda]|nr:hypothetical protein [Xylographa trunciseda]